MKKMGEISFHILVEIIPSFVSCDPNTEGEITCIPSSCFAISV